MTSVILPLKAECFNLALGGGVRAVDRQAGVCDESKAVMNATKTTGQKDWTHLLTDPELVGHIGKLLQAYREAPADKREEALLHAMREIRKQSASASSGSSNTSGSSSGSAGPTTGTRTGSSHSAATAVATKTEEAPAKARSEKAQAGLETIALAETEVNAAMKTATNAAEAKSMPPPALQPPFVPDMFTPSFGQDRRHYPRIRCFIAVELRCEGWEAPVWGNLANVSAGGCYIETLEPIRKHTKLQVGLWANNGKVWVKGIVINGIVTENNPTFGVRLQYTDMDIGSRETLRFFLRFVEDTSKNYEKQNGYLAHLKR